MFAYLEISSFLVFLLQVDIFVQLELENASRRIEYTSFLSG